MRNSKVLIFLAWGVLLYVVSFSSWWMILLIRTEHENFQSKKELISIYNIDSEEQLTQQFTRNKRMIIYEGAAFLIILLVAAFFIFRLIYRQQTFIEQKRNFLLATTHELNTPLASIKLNLQTLQLPELPKQDQQKLLSNSQTEINRLQQLIQNILVASKIDANEQLTSRELVHLSSLVQKNINKKNNSRIQAQIQPSLHILADTASVEIILLNLVDNALKYSPQDTKVTIQLTQENQTAVLSVIDQGKGILDKEKNEVFRRFYRGEDERTRQSKGTGLGLFLVKEMTKLNQGKIILKDNQPKGCIFEVKFPLIHA